MKISIGDKHSNPKDIFHKDEKIFWSKVEVNVKKNPNTSINIKEITKGTKFKSKEMDICIKSMVKKIETTPSHNIVLTDLKNNAKTGEFNTWINDFVSSISDNPELSGKSLSFTIDPDDPFKNN